MVVVEEVGRITCEWGVLAKGPDSSFGEVHRGSCSEPIHKEDEVKDQKDEVEDRRDK